MSCTTRVVHANSTRGQPLFLPNHALPESENIHNLPQNTSPRQCMHHAYSGNVPVASCHARPRLPSLVASPLFPSSPRACRRLPLRPLSPLLAPDRSAVDVAIGRHCRRSRSRRHRLALFVYLPASLRLLFECGCMLWRHFGVVLSRVSRRLRVVTK